MKIKILAQASRDLMEGFYFYEQKAPGLGADFLQTIFADIDLLTSTAGIFPYYLYPYRRALTKRFPFAIFFRIDNDTVIVDAVLDCRRDPAWIRKRLLN